MSLLQSKKSENQKKIEILEDGMIRNSIKTRKYLMNNFKIDLIQMS